MGEYQACMGVPSMHALLGTRPVFYDVIGCSICQRFNGVMAIAFRRWSLLSHRRCWRAATSGSASRPLSTPLLSTPPPRAASAITTATAMQHDRASVFSGEQPGGAGQITRAAGQAGPRRRHCTGATPPPGRSAACSDAPGCRRCQGCWCPLRSPRWPHAAHAPGGPR